jgi:hypothetical protein
MPELGSYGSVRGAAGNSRPYRECRPSTAVRRSPAAGVRKPPRNEPAGDSAERLPHTPLWGIE